MKIFFNCSVNVVGGAIQNSANFIKNAINDSSNEFLFVVSNQVAQVLSAWGIKADSIIEIESPARSSESRKKLLQLEEGFQPDIVYTMAGPTYVKFKGLHIMGISDPYITHADWLSIFLNRSAGEAAKFYGKEIIKGLHARRTADFFIFQTETSRSGFCNRFLLDRKNTYLLPNAIGADFGRFQAVARSRRKNNKIIFVPSAYYPHKNLEIILEMVSLLVAEDSADFCFITTAPFDSVFSKRIQELELQNHINNIGPYSYSDAADLYERADLIFIPSVLETFSTSYLEAIAAGKPLVVADREFSREVCGSYAWYYSPLSAREALKCVDMALSRPVNSCERERIVSFYGSQVQRYELAVSILKDVINRVN